MSATPHIASRLQDLVHRHNREVVLEATLKAILGIVFSFFTFGFLFWLGWVVGWFVAGSLPLRAWHCGALLAGLFFVVALWSAWHQVDPLAGLQPLTDRQWFLTQLSLASPSLVYFSPRHALAGSAVLLLGGPSNVFQALGLWAYRLRADESLIEEAAQLLTACSATTPVEQIRSPAAALLLRRLALIKVVPRGESAALALTEKGSKVLSRAKVRVSRRGAHQGEAGAKQ